MQILHSRRRFMKLCAAVSGTLAAGAFTATLEGCAFNIEDAINTVLDSALALLKGAEPGASWIAPLANAITALEQAEATWQSGGAATIVIDALNTIEAVLAVIPATAAVSPLIDILIAGIEAVMSAFGLTAQPSRSASAKRAVIVNSPRYRVAKLNGTSFLHPTWQGAYKAQWNIECDQVKQPQCKIR